MKNFNMILPLTIIFFILSGCNSSETPTISSESGVKVTESEVEIMEENQEHTEVKNEIIEEEIEKDLVSKLKNYETIVLESTDENHQIIIKYPKFNYAPLDEVLFDKHKEFEGQQEQEEINRLEGIQDYYSYESTFEEPIITESIVSIYFDGRFYQGGGFSFSNTLNFDLKNDRVITINDVLKQHSISLEVIADLVSQKLITDERFAEFREDPITERYKTAVKEETIPVESNYSSFTLTEKSITFYKQYTSIFSNAMGIVDVEITWDELEDYKEVFYEKTDVESVQGPITYNFGDSVEPENTLKYIDQEYGFSVDIPQSWNDKYLVRIAEDYYENLPKEPSKSIDFSMVDDGKYIGDLFSIEVLEGISEEEVKEYYKDWPGFEGFIGAENGIVLVYTRPGMMPEQLYGEAYVETGNQFSKMVEEDMPKILETLQFK